MVFVMNFVISSVPLLLMFLYFSSFWLLNKINDIYIQNLGYHLPYFIRSAIAK